MENNDVIKALITLGVCPNDTVSLHTATPMKMVSLQRNLPMIICFLFKPQFAQCDVIH